MSGDSPAASSAQPSPTPWRYGDACLSCDAVTANTTRRTSVRRGLPLGTFLVAVSADGVVFGLFPTFLEEMPRLGLVATVVVVHIWARAARRVLTQTYLS